MWSGIRREGWRTYGMVSLLKKHSVLDGDYEHVPRVQGPSRLCCHHPMLQGYGSWTQGQGLRHQDHQVGEHPPPDIWFLISNPSICRCEVVEA